MSYGTNKLEVILNLLEAEKRVYNGYTEYKVVVDTTTYVLHVTSNNTYLLAVFTEIGGNSRKQSTIRFNSPIATYTYFQKILEEGSNG